WVLDTRQYRSDQACFDRPGRLCREALDPTRTMTGTEQKAWLKSGLRQSTKIWNVVAQQVIFQPLIFNDALLNPDQWDGYPIERQELLDAFAEKGNVLILTGDIHAAGFAAMNAKAADFNSPLIGYEVVGTSITSGGDIPLEG